MVRAGLEVGGMLGGVLGQSVGIASTDHLGIWRHRDWRFDFGIVAKVRINANSLPPLKAITMQRIRIQADERTTLM